jgi:hypothetical protein
MADRPDSVSRVLADMRVMPFIHVMYGIVILRGAAVALDGSDGSGLLGCNWLCHGVDSCPKVMIITRWLI